MRNVTARTGEQSEEESSDISSDDEEEEIGSDDVDSDDLGWKDRLGYPHAAGLRSVVVIFASLLMICLPAVPGWFYFLFS
jgi:hypothetical protein